MKSLIIYYSYTGVTDKVAGIFADVLQKRGETAIQRLRPKAEIASFFGQCRAAFTRKRTELVEEDISFDVSRYDLILIGSPVWAFAPAPAINTYLDRMSGLNGKRTVILLTSGSGMGVKMCFKNIRKVLESKGASSIDEINIPNSKMGKPDFIASCLEKTL